MAPYAATFRFTMSGHGAAFLEQQCSLMFSVTACADGYSQPLALDGSCTVDCSDSGQGCIACGACMDSSTEVTTGAPAEYAWAGLTYTFGQTKDGCPCHSGSPAPAAKYRLTVPVYFTGDDAVNHVNARQVTVDFTLPAPNGIVEVPLDAPTP